MPFISSIFRNSSTSIKRPFNEDSRDLSAVDLQLKESRIRIEDERSGNRKGQEDIKLRSLTKSAGTYQNFINTCILQQKKIPIELNLENLMKQASKDVISSLNVKNKVSKAFILDDDTNPEFKIKKSRIPKFTLLHYSRFKACWDWLILVLVIYTAIFTPYVTAFLLNDIDTNSFSFYMIQQKNESKNIKIDLKINYKKKR